MEIAFVTEHTCIRVTKEAIALKLAGHNVHLISKKLLTPDWYESQMYIDCPKKVEEAARIYAPFVDIFVVHNEPSWFAALIKKTVPHKKVVLEYHDSKYWYMDSDKEILLPNEKITWYEEDYTVDLVDGFIVPSQACLEEVRTRTDKPIAWLPPAALRNQYKWHANNFGGGLCSQGGHAVPGEYMRPAEHWRDYTKLYKYLKGRCAIYAYSPTFTDTEHKVAEYYKGLGAIVNVLSYDPLIDAIGQHSWNLVGNWITHDVWKYSNPNKFYDALAAGTPSVVFNTASIKEIVEETKMGIFVNHPDELLERWGEHRECRKNVMLYREKYAMENFIGRAIDLYKEVLKA